MDIHRINGKDSKPINYIINPRNLIVTNTSHSIQLFPLISILAKVTIQQLWHTCVRMVGKAEFIHQTHDNLKARFQRPLDCKAARSSGFWSYFEYSRVLTGNPLSCAEDFVTRLSPAYRGGSGAWKQSLRVFSGFSVTYFAANPDD